MPGGLSANSKVDAHEIAEHKTIDAVFQIAFSEAGIHSVHLKLPFGNTGPVKRVVVYVVGLIFVHDQKERQYFLDQIRAGRGWDI